MDSNRFTNAELEAIVAYAKRWEGKDTSNSLAHGALLAQLILEVRDLKELLRRES